MTRSNNVRGAIPAPKVVAALAAADAALAESEARFRMMADSIPQLAWMSRGDGTMTWFNQRFLDYTGYTYARMLETGWNDIQHPDHRDGVTSRFRAAVAAQVSWDDTFPLRGADGSYRWFLSRALPVVDRDAGTVRWFGTHTDITEQVAGEAERERLLQAAHEARRAAEQASRARTEFLAVMSHELRTPLNAIGGYADLLDMGLRGPVTDAQRADYARIRHSTQHLLGLINEILNFAKLESGTVGFASDDVRAADVVHDVTGMILPQASLKGLRLTVDECPAFIAVRADREKLRQILVNLTINGIKFTPPPGEVRLSVEASDDVVRFSVHDTGIGIPAARLDAVFEPFVQVHAELTRVVDGAGLGLSISRVLARGMGGDLTVNSTPGIGSVFTLTLPRSPDAQVDVVRDGVRSAQASDLAAAVRATGEILANEDSYSALRFINARTSHRFTGVYRFDGAILRSVALFDRADPGRTRGPDAPVARTYCAMVGALERSLSFTVAMSDAGLPADPSREDVVSYCGALVRGRDGAALGTVCSFDVEARPVPAHEIPLLEAVAPLFATAILADVARTSPASLNVGEFA